jgi:hypothetical protein
MFKNSATQQVELTGLMHQGIQTVHCQDVWIKKDAGREKETNEIYTCTLNTHDKCKHFKLDKQMLLSNGCQKSIHI